MWYRLNTFFFQVWFTLLFGFRVEGRHHEPPPPYILVANHASAVDIPLVAIAARAPVAFAAKGDLLQIPAVGWWIRSVGSFFVRRGEPDREAVRTALRILNRGRVVGFFAEGTRSLDGRLQAFEEGAAYLALKAGVPVLPVGIAGSHRTMPVGARGVRRFPVLVRMGPPIAVPRVVGPLTRATVLEWTRRLRSAVADLLPPEQRPLPEAEEGAYIQRSRPR